MEQYNSTATVRYDADLLTSLPTVDAVLDAHASVLGSDQVGYRNHIYRVINLCLAIVGDRAVELEKLTIAAVFHDLGIWTNHTFDYITPSVALAREHLTRRGLADWMPEIEAMIVNHHKVTASPAHQSPLVESFRKADWIDVSYGLRTFGLSRRFIAAVRTTWPDMGFHRRLIQLTINRSWKHPLTPLPMLKW